MIVPLINVSTALTIPRGGVLAAPLFDFNTGPLLMPKGISGSTVVLLLVTYVPFLPFLLGLFVHSEAASMQ